MEKTWLWDRLWEYDGKTPGHPSSNHDHRITWWPSTRNHGSPGDRLCSHNNTANLGWCFNRRWESMELNRQSSDQCEDDIRPWGTPQLSDQPFPRQPWTWSLRNPEDWRARITRLLLACDGVRDTDVHWRQRAVPPNQSTASRTICTQHATATAFMSLGGTYHGLHYQVPRVNRIGIHRDRGNHRPCD